MEENTAEPLDKNDGHMKVHRESCKRPPSESCRPVESAGFYTWLAQAQVESTQPIIQCYLAGFARP